MKWLVPQPRQTFVFLCVHALISISWIDSGVLAEPAGSAGDGPGRGPGPGGGTCPRVCFCNSNSKIMYCAQKGLPGIPSTMPSGTLQLNLNNNLFASTSLVRSNFSASHLAPLEHLYMSDCGIENIAVDTFRDLINLEWLDISNNRIKVVQDYTFRGLQLQHLFLNGNRHISLQPKALDGMTTTGLYLHDCSLPRLHPEVLTPLNNSIKYLWVHSNEIDRVERRLSPLFASLSHLRLGSNPLHCNCELLWLKEFYDRHGEIFKGATSPSCLTPNRLKGKFFNEMAMTDFRCQAPIFNNIDAVFDGHQGRLKCTATGDPAPTLYWIQPNGRTTKYVAPSEEEARRNEGLLSLSQTPGSDQSLAGMYICVANNEAGNVTLTINVSWPHNRIVTYKTVASEGDNGQRTVVPDLNSLFSGSSPAPLSHRNDEFSVTLNPGRKGGNAGLTPGSDTRLRESLSNRSALNVQVGSEPPSGGTRFNLSELIGAIVGTFLCTLLLCLLVIPMYYRRKWKSYSASCRHNSRHKLPPIPAESVYLNGLGHHPSNYMDIPSLKR